MTHGTENAVVFTCFISEKQILTFSNPLQRKTEPLMLKIVLHFTVLILSLTMFFFKLRVILMVKHATIIRSVQTAQQ